MFSIVSACRIHQTIGIKWKIPEPVNVPTAKYFFLENQINSTPSLLPKPIKALKIHLNADFFRNGSIIAPQSAEQFIKVTVSNPIIISSTTKSSIHIVLHLQIFYFSTTFVDLSSYNHHSISHESDRIQFVVDHFDLHSHI